MNKLKRIIELEDAFRKRYGKKTIVETFTDVDDKGNYKFAIVNKTWG
jgi:hypothetical protein